MLLISTLRIKKCFFDSIGRGEKKTEYRDFKPFYSNLLNRDIKKIKFHYQGGEYIITECLGVKVIKRPDSLKKSAIPFGPTVLEISLGKILEFVRK